MIKKETAKNSPGTFKPGRPSQPQQHVYALHQAKGNTSVGDAMVGFLGKRSEGRLRNVWQRRRCLVQDGHLHVFHGDEAKPPARVNLLTCQMKPVPEEKLCFDVVTFRRTYHFQAENEQTFDDWMSVLLNAKDASLRREFQTVGASEDSQTLVALRQSVVRAIMRAPGNERCCDCDSINDATWLSTNFGVIVCIECSGIHRELGVHISKVQSLLLDNLGTSQLLVASQCSNQQFNRVAEAGATTKLNPNSTMHERRHFIRDKYEKMAFVRPTCATEASVFDDLKRSAVSRNLSDLMRVFGEMKRRNLDLTHPLPSCPKGETILHYAILHDDGSLLHVVDFIVQNSPSLDRQTSDGNTALHYSVSANQTEVTRLLLRSGANPSLENRQQKTPLAIAVQKEHKPCEELILHALEGKKSLFRNVSIAWDFCQDDGCVTDFSDDEILEIQESQAISSDEPPIHFTSTPTSVPLPSNNNTLKVKNRTVRPGSDDTPGFDSFESTNITFVGKTKSFLPTPLEHQSDSQQIRLTHYHKMQSPSKLVPSASRSPSLVLNDANLPGSEDSELKYDSSKLCRALYDCKADNEDELSFVEGDVLVIVKEKTDDVDWFLGHLLKDSSKSGLFPSSFVVRI